MGSDATLENYVTTINEQTSEREKTRQTQTHSSVGRQTIAYARLATPCKTHGMFVPAQFMPIKPIKTIASRRYKFTLGLDLLAALRTKTKLSI